MNREIPSRKFGAILACVFVLALTACGGEDSSGSTPEGSGELSGTRSSSDGTDVSGEATAAREETTVRDKVEPAEATIGPNENSSMVPAGGRKPDPAQPPPQNPPEAVRTFPATTNRNVEGRSIEYERKPPTNGDHAPIWQNCGFYEKPVKDVYAVHSLDHGAVWITYRPNLPPGQVDELRSYGDERYVLISPYPSQDAPVIATSWRVQLELNGTDDPRLRQFVDQFRISELAPLSGNRCIGGVGDPHK